MQMRNISLELQAIVGGWLGSLDVVPFRWARPAFRWSNECFGRDRGFHIYAGPLHVWTSDQFFALLEFGFKIGSNPWHGSPLVARKARSAVTPSTASGNKSLSEDGGE